MGRPPAYEWQALGLDDDPVPGDPASVSQEAAHLSGVAKTISDQVTALNKIASGGTNEVLKGHYADKIRSAAGDLSGQLGKVVGRYQKASSALNDYVPDLEKAQSMSLTALHEATGPHSQLASLSGQKLPSGSNLTTAQQQQVTDHKNAVSKAQAAIGEAKGLLHKATSLRDSSAGTCAHKIHTASDDSMKDHHSLWGAIKSAVHAAAGWIKTACTVLEIVGLVLAVIAFVIAQFIPGLDFLVDGLVLAAFWTTFAAMLGRGVLAGTGNGSWWDFALDAFACLTFGGGRLLGAGLKALSEGGEATAKGFIAGQRALNVLCGSDELVPDLAKVPEEIPELKAVLNLGATGEEADAFKSIYSVSSRFAGSAADNLDQARTIVKLMGGLAGAGAGGGIFGLAGGGIALGPDADNPSVNLQLPVHSFTNWYVSTFEEPTGG
ncbi:MAG TPA: hypothetical protein VFV41_24005 [Streptosporangiaceae bacterium]|nr:hypothetical protein [Streptosporangiaceae bacterium]